MVGIIKRGSPYLVGVELLNDAYIIFVVVAQVEVTVVEVTVVQNDQYGVFTLEFAQIFTSSVIVEAEYVTVEPYFTPAEGRTAFLFQGNFVYRQTGEDDTACLSTFNAHFAEVLLEDDARTRGLGFNVTLMISASPFGLALK